MPLDLFAKVPAEPLGAYRIAFGITLFLIYLSDLRNVRQYYSGEGFLSADVMPGLLRYLHFSLLDSIESSIAVHVTYFILLVVIVFFTIGYKTKLMSIIQFVLVLSFHERNILVLNSGDTLMRAMSFLVIFVPIGAAYSIDSWRGKTERWQLLLLQIQFLMVYIFAAGAKIGHAIFRDGNSWTEGTAINYIFRNNLWNRWPMEWIGDMPTVVWLMSWGGLIIMTIFPILVWTRLRRVALMLGIVFHGIILIFLDVGWFSIIAIGGYTLFLTKEELSSVNLKKIQKMRNKMKLILPLLVVLAVAVAACTTPVEEPTNNQEDFEPLDQEANTAPEAPNVPPTPPAEFPDPVNPAADDSDSMIDDDSTAGHEIRITASGFEPNDLNIKVGDTVTFVNEDGPARWPASDRHPTHTEYPGVDYSGGKYAGSEACIAEGQAKSGAFDPCTTIGPGDQWSFTFTQAGSFDYHDHRSPSAGGTIDVE